MAIDVHAHYGTYRRDDVSSFLNGWATGDAATVADRARKASIRLTIVSPLSGLLPRGRADVVSANVEASEIVRRTSGLLQWVVVHPEQPDTFVQAAELLSSPHCVGIKIHPEEHQYEIREHGDRLFEFAARHNAVVLAHSGDPKSWPRDFTSFANEYSTVFNSIEVAQYSFTPISATETQLFVTPANANTTEYIINIQLTRRF